MTQPLKVTGCATIGRDQRCNSCLYCDAAPEPLGISNRRKIARKAVELCAEGESIIINGGSSTYMMGEFLADRHLNILTNSFYLARDLMENSGNQVTLPGGEIYRCQGIVLSSFEVDSIQYYHGTKMFMGTPGIGEFGVMESAPPFGQVGTETVEADGETHRPCG